MVVLIWLGDLMLKQKQFKKRDRLHSYHLASNFQTFFLFIPMKIGFSVNIYRLARMARNFNDYPGFQPKTTFMYYFAHDCMIGRCAYSFPCPSFKERCSSQQKGTTKSRCGLKVSPLSSYCLGAATDYGHTKAKSLIICGPNSNPNPKKLFGMWI